MQKDIETLSNKDTHPHIIVATPGRLNALVRDKKLRLGSVKVFVLDECDKMLDQIGNSHLKLRIYVQKLSHHFRHAPRRPGHLPRHSYPKAGHDVQRYPRSGDSPNLQEIHAESSGDLR